MTATPAAAAVVDRRFGELYKAGDFDTGVAYRVVNVAPPALLDPPVAATFFGRAAEAVLCVVPGAGRELDPTSVLLEVAVQVAPPAWSTPIEAESITYPVTSIVATALVRTVKS